MKILDRIKSYAVGPAEARDRLSTLIIELRARGIDFRIELVEEDGHTYYYAHSVDYPKGYIDATASTPQELETELKNAIFAAFSIPVKYANPTIINFNPALSSKPATEKLRVYATT